MKKKSDLVGPRSASKKGFPRDEMLRRPLSHRGGETNWSDSFRELRRDVNQKLGER